MDARTGDWQTIGVNSPNPLSLSIHRLKPTTRYQFMVVARTTDTGAALFSSPVNATTKGRIIVIVGAARQLTEIYIERNGLILTGP